MSWGHPERLWLLVGWLALAAWTWRGLGVRRRGWAGLGRVGRPPRDPSLAWLLALPLVIGALAQPRWGRGDGEPPPPGRDVVLLIDVSRSMAAEDAVPNRLGVAIESAVGLIDALAGSEGDRVAVIAFAGVAATRCGLTSNLGAAREVVRSLRPGSIEPGETDLAGAIDSAIDAFDDLENSGGKVVVAFTDGEDHVGAWRSALDRWRSSGVVVHGVSIGDDSQGHPIPVPGGGSLTFDGRVVETRRRDAPLEAAREATGGVLVKLGLSTADMARLHREAIAPIEARRRSTRPEREPAERFQPLLIAALGLGLFGLRTGPRRLAGSSGLAILLFVGLAANRPDSPDEWVERGRQAYRANQPREALAAFDEAARLRPDSALIQFNRASALFQLGKLDEAERTYAAIRTRAEPELRSKIDYALGNTRLMLDDPAGAIEHYDRCLAESAGNAALAPTRADAAANREYARRRLEPPKVDAPKSSAPDADAPDEGREKPADPPPAGQPKAGSAGTSAGPKQGGAGGLGEAGEMTPEERLRNAVDAIRRVKESLDGEESVPEPSRVGSTRKDW